MVLQGEYMETPECVSKMNRCKYYKHKVSK